MVSLPIHLATLQPNILRTTPPYPPYITVLFSATTLVIGMQPL